MIYFLRNINWCGGKNFTLCDFGDNFQILSQAASFLTLPLKILQLINIIVFFAYLLHLHY